MRSINDCPIPDGPSTPPDPEAFACDICGERDGHVCTLRGYDLSGDDLEKLWKAARRRGVVHIRDWLHKINWSQTPQGFIYFRDESSSAQKARAKKLIAFARDVLDHVEEWSR